MPFRGTIRPAHSRATYVGSEGELEVVSERSAGVVEIFPELFSSSESSYQGDAPGDAQGSPTWPDRLLAEQLDDEEASEVRYYGGGGSPTGSGTPLMYQEREKPNDEPRPAAASPTLSDRPLIEQVRVVEPAPMSDAASEPLNEARSEQSLNEQMAELLDTIRRAAASPTESERPLIDQLREEQADDDMSSYKLDTAPQRFRQPEISDYSSSEDNSHPSSSRTDREPENSESGERESDASSYSTSDDNTAPDDSPGEATAAKVAEEQAEGNTNQKEEEKGETCRELDEIEEPLDDDGYSGADEREDEDMGDAAEEVEDDHSIDEAERSLVHYHQPHGMASPRVLEAGSDALALALPDNLAMEWLGGYPRVVEIASEMGRVEPLQLKSRHIAGLLEAPENAPIVEFPGSPRRIEARPDDEEGASLDELYPIIEVLDDEAAAPDAAGNPLIELPSTAIKRRVNE
ncbi:hypothetical protein GGH95_002924 [Coemansia sp. RSA 1836]|nr:hypothetical protein GGH95_002924 [Coemansia sp. RSA 1836]